MTPVAAALQSDDISAFAEPIRWDPTDDNGDARPAWPDGTQDQVVPLQMGSVEVVIKHKANEDITWIQHLVQDLHRLSQLPPNWDSYGARRIEQDKLQQALDIAHEVVTEHEMPSPAVSATAAGGVALQWHSNDWEFEVVVEGVSPYVAYRFDKRTGREWEGTVRGPDEIAAKIKPWLRLATINGADEDAADELDGWTRTIQPLGMGTYDSSKLLKALKSIGYEGPVILHTGGGLARRTPAGHQRTSFKRFQEIVDALNED